MLKKIILLVLLILVFREENLFCQNKEISQITASNEKIKKTSLTITNFDSGEEQEFLEFIESVEPSVEKSYVVFENNERGKRWLRFFKKKKKRLAVSVPENSNSIDKGGVIVAVLRTAGSSVLWIMSGDFGLMQSLLTVLFQGVNHYSFTYKGYGLDFLNFSHDKSLNLAKYLGLDMDRSKTFKTFVKQSAEFFMSYSIGGLFLGVVAWDNFIEVYSHHQIYVDLTYYTTLGLIATGSWKVFLSDQRARNNTLLSEKAGMNIYRFNGLVVTIAYPVMINGHWAGDAMFGALSMTGLIAVFRGERILSYFNRRKNFNGGFCHRLFVGI